MESFGAVASGSCYMLNNIYFPYGIIDGGNHDDAFRGTSMNLQYLRSFYVTVKLNSISKAARSLHLTQPGLSIQIQSLEKDLGVTLLTRSNKGVELTEAGEIVFDYAETILSMKENIERDLQNLKDNKKGLLLGSCKAIGEFALPCSLYIFKQEHPRVNIQFDISNTDEIISKIKNRTINLGIIQGNPMDEALYTENITCDRLLLVASIPSQREEISLNELKNLPLIFREPGSGTRQAIQQTLTTRGIDLEDLNVIYELNSMEAIKASVISGKGISFIPELTIKRELKDGILKEIKIENIDFYSHYYVAYRKDHCLNSEENQFIHFIKSSNRGFC